MNENERVLHSVRCSDIYFLVVAVVVIHIRWMTLHNGRQWWVCRGWLAGCLPAKCMDELADRHKDRQTNSRIQRQTNRQKYLGLRVSHSSFFGGYRMEKLQTSEPNYFVSVMSYNCSNNIRTAKAVPSKPSVLCLKMKCARIGICGFIKYFYYDYLKF